MKAQYTAIGYASIIAMISILGGTLIASVVGMQKATITNTILAQSRQHASTEAQAQANTQAAMGFLQRAHTHAQGLGVTALIISVLLAHTALKPLMQRLISLGISLGALSYSFCLLYVGSLAGVKGKAAAVADMHYVAMGSVAMHGALIGVVIALLALYHMKLRWFVQFLFVTENPATTRAPQVIRMRSGSPPIFPQRAFTHV